MVGVGEFRLFPILAEQVLGVPGGGSGMFGRGIREQTPLVFIPLTIILLTIIPSSL